MSFKTIALITSTTFLLLLTIRIITSGPSLFASETIHFWQISNYKGKAKAGDEDAAIALYHYYGQCEFLKEKQQQWLRISAENGNANFQLLYAHKLLESGRVDDGIQWTKISADQHNFYATLDMAGYYEAGMHVKKDISIAVKYYVKAANDESLEAMMKLSDDLADHTSCQDRRHWLGTTVKKTKPGYMYHDKAKQLLQDLECS